jgi:phage tail sheath protein FI
MATTYTYPGVYIEEISSGVRTISGVSTSVTAFVGQAPRGPIERPVRLLSFADYERAFGGLAKEAEMGYAIRQFYLNGGAEAYAVRLAGSAAAAELTLTNGAGANVLKLTAADEGVAGNSIKVAIVHPANNPNTFGLSLFYDPPGQPGDRRSEQFDGLSMNSDDARAVASMVNGVSQLVTAEVVHNLQGLPAGTSTSGRLVDNDGNDLDLAGLVDASHDRFLVSVNGLTPVLVIIRAGDIPAGNLAAQLASLCTAIKTQVTAAANGRPPLTGFNCAPNAANNRIVMTSGEAGEHSTVRILPADRNDLARRLKLGNDFGGQDVDAVSTIRPREVPDRATLTSGTFAANELDNLPRKDAVAGSLTSDAFAPNELDALPDPAQQDFNISLNGGPPMLVTVPGPAIGPGALTAQLTTLSGRIQSAVRALDNTKPEFRDFTCAPNATNDRLVLTSGAGGASSAVAVTAAPANDIAGSLHLLAGTTATAGVDAQLTFLLSLDGEPAVPIDVPGDPIGALPVADQLTDLAGRIEAAVRAKKPAVPGFQGFTCRVGTGNDTLVLTSGTGGSTSSIVVSAAPNDIAAALNLLAGATATAGADATLTGGNEQPYTDATAYSVFVNDQSQRKGIYALEHVDLFNLLCLPGISNPDILIAAAAYCQERRAFLIADSPRPNGTPMRPAEMEVLVRSPDLPKSEYGAVYYPWIKAPDPLDNGKLRDFPPSGTVAGLYARTDATRGVWKAPAGTDAVLVGARGLAYSMTDLENGTLNPLGVNAIRTFPVYGIVAWGARTLRGANEMTSEYKYIPIRRLALFLEESLFRGTQWVVFEPNDEPLWAQIRLNIGAFMQGLFRQGAFQGKSPREAYFVKCDGETTTQNDINLGIVNIVVGFAPLKPAEFVVIKIQQIAGQIPT